MYIVCVVRRLNENKIYNMCMDKKTMSLQYSSPTSAAILNVLNLILNYD